MLHSSHSRSCNMNSCPHYVGLCSQHVLGSQRRELEPFDGCEVIKHLPTNFAGARVRNTAQFTGGGGAGQKKLTVLCRRVQDDKFAIFHVIPPGLKDKESNQQPSSSHFLVRLLLVNV